MVDSAETPFKIMGCIGGVLCFSWRAHQFLTHLVFFLMFPFFSTCVLCTTLSNCLALSEHSELEQPAGRECITLFFQDMVDSAETPFKIMGCIGGVLCFSWRAHQFLTHLVFFLMFPFFPTCVLCTTLSNGLALSEHSELEQPAVEKGLYGSELSVKTLLVALKMNKVVKSLDLENHRMVWKREFLKSGLQDCSFLSSLNIRGNGFTTEKQRSGFPSRLSVLF
ncbi:hypothetical protein DFJ73DRAFT_345903 [Zopfochytrium polystomum]|nr:hypothetical protein DFJ73DRAFT_345903 [Zopfochytrium polystomum]